MTTTLRPSGLRGWSGRFVIIAISVAFCAPAFAGSESTIVSQPTKVKTTQKVVRKLCYVKLGLGLPQPCEWFAGPEPTTAIPMDIIGRLPH
jgi:hypothetical protein